MSWQEIRVGDLGEIITGKTPPTSNVDNYGGNIPFITPSDMVGNRSIVSTERYISEKGKNTIKNCLLPPHAVCVSCIGSDMGKVVLTTAWSATNQQINSILCNSQYDYRFVYYLVLTLRETIKSLGKNATAVPILNKTKFSNIQVAVPSLPIQKRIADFLSYYDDLIENNQKQIKLLEEAAQRLYKEWFVDLRFPGHETTPIVNGVPEGWKQDTINSIIELQSGFAFKSADFCASGTYKIVTIKNVQDGLFDGQNVSRINSIPARMPTHCRLNDGDILLSLTGNVGRVCVVNGQDYLLNQRVAKIKSDYPAYAYCLFRSSDMFTAMGNLANGAAQQNLSPIKTGQIKILIPPVSLLIHFEVTASAYMKQMLNLNKQIELLQQARDRLLPKLMSGEIEV